MPAKKETATLPRRRTASKDLRAIESYLVDAFLEAHAESGDGIALTQSDGLVYANNALARTLLWTNEELTERRAFLSLVAEDERSRLGTRLRLRLQAPGGIDRGETVLVRKDGVNLPVEYVAKRVGPNGENSTLWIIHDISRERWANAEWRANEERFQALCRAVGDGVLVLAPDGSIVEANEGAQRLLGAPQAQWKGRPFTSLLPTRRHKDYQKAIDQFDPALKDPGFHQPFELDVVRADGSEVFAECVIMKSLIGGQERFLLVVRDVSERGAAQASLRKSITDLERLNTAKSEFINMAAHELRTPLAPIKAELAMLRSSPVSGLGKDQQRSVEALSRNLERMSKFVEDLLEVSRMQSGKLEFREEDVNLGRIVTNTVALFEAAAQYGGVALRIEVPSKPVPFRGDPARLEQVLFNLVSNALRFTPRGGAVHVHLKATTEGKALVEVRDTGIGIESKEIPKLFVPFGIIAKDRQLAQRGAGLGLFICKTIVEHHGGRIWVRSPGRDKGSTFSCELPLDRGPP